jgi:predicted peroxiredoxin
MSKDFFIKLVTSPDVDPLKCVVGLGCVAQAINDGHKVDVFFAAAAVQLLHAEYLSNLDKTIDAPSGMCQGFIKTIMNGANGIHCSTASQAHFGVSQDSPKALVEGINLNWSGPAGVIALASDAEVTLMY